IKENFTFEGVDEAKMYKKNLNKNYIKKGLTPDFTKHPKLRCNWDSFKYYHHLGPGGYKKGIIKWKRMEDDIIAKGIVPATLKWPEQAKHWYYAHGGTLNPKNGSFVFGQELREAAMRLVELIKSTAEGSFVPDREKDELTMALGNPEHPGYCRGKGVIPWKFAFREHIDSYRRHQISKARTTAVRMEEAIDRREQLHHQGANVDVSPYQHRSSVASTEAPAGGPSDMVEDNQRHPMDDITVRVPCEFVNPVKNKLILVSYGVTEQPTKGQRIHGVEILARGYAKVRVDRVVNGWDDLKLEVPGSDKEKNLGETIHGWILWPKRYIRIPQPNPSTLGLSPQGSSARLPTPSARAPSPLANRDPSMSQHSPPADRDPNMILLTAATKKKPKEKQPEPKKPYDITYAKLDAVVDAQVKAHFAPKPPIKKDTPLDRVKFQVFIRSMELEKKKKSEKPPLSDYDRTITKAFQKKKKSGSTIPQLGTQSNQSVATLQKFELGKPLVWPQFSNEDVQIAPIVHGGFSQRFSHGRSLDWRSTLFRGEAIINVPLEEFYFLYNQDALDKSLISSWVFHYAMPYLLFYFVSCMMEIQACRRIGLYDVGFMDPNVINEANVRDKPNRTLKNIYNFLDKQHYKKYILLPYNFNMVYILDSLRTPRNQYTNLIDMLNRAWARFRQHHLGEFKKQLHIHFEFSVCIEFTHLVSLP
ncbi:hypothetical protein SETIT_5G162700v2, partial [Setaria italica]